MWPFSMQIIAFGSSQSGKYSLFCMLDVWGLTEMTDVWIYEKLLAGICIKVLDLLTKNVFCHPISFHFYLCNHFQSPVFAQWHSIAKSLQSLLSDTHSFNLARSIIAQELYIDTLMVHASQIPLILCLAPLQSHSWPFKSTCTGICSWMDYWMG